MLTRTGVGALALGVSSPAAAQTIESIPAATLQLIWVAVCCGLVLMMQPGFALLESGLARSKNAVNVLMKNFTDCAITSLAFWMVGFGLLFGSNPSGWFGTSDFMPASGDGLVNVQVAGPRAPAGRKLDMRWARALSNRAEVEGAGKRASFFVQLDGLGLKA